MSRHSIKNEIKTFLTKYLYNAFLMGTYLIKFTDCLSTAWVRSSEKIIIFVISCRSFWVTLNINRCLWKYVRLGEQVHNPILVIIITIMNLKGLP